MSFKRSLVAMIASLVWLVAQSTVSSAEQIRIVAFGDSLMAGYQLNTGQSFPEKLEAALREKGHDIVIANASVSGDTTSGGLSRLDWSVPDETDLVILELGANDMLRGVSPEITRNNLSEMITRLERRDIAVMLAGMLAAPNLGATYATGFNAIYPDLAREHDVPLYPFFLDGVAAEKSLLLEDGMHPSARGVDVMVERFLPVIEQALAEHAAAE